MPPSTVALGTSAPTSERGISAVRELEAKAREFASLTIPPRTPPPSPPAPVRGPWPAFLFLASALMLTGTVLGWAFR